MVFEVGALDGPAHARPQVLGAACHGDGAVGGGEHAVQRMHQRVTAVGAARFLAGQQQMGVLDGLQPDLPAQQAHVHPLASAGALTGVQRSQNAGLEVLCAAVVGHERPVGGQRPAVEAARRDHSARCLPGDVGAFAVGLGTVGAEEAACGPDDAGVHGREVVVAQAPLVERAGLEVRQHHVGGLHQLQERFLACFDAQVECDGALAAVAGDVDRRMAVVLEHVHMAAHVAHSGQLDLDDLGAETVQHGCRLRSLHQRGQVQNSYSVECSGHGSPSQRDPAIRQRWY